MKPNLKLLVAIATLITAAAARARTHDPTEPDGGGRAKVISSELITAVDDAAPGLKSADIGCAPGDRTDAGEPRASKAESEHCAFVRSIWTSP